MKLILQLLIVLSLSSLFVACKKDDDLEMSQIVSAAQSIQYNNSQSSFSETLIRSNIPYPFFGINAANTVKNISYNTPGFRDLLQKLNPQIVRVPGGTTANYWDWRTGWFQNALTTPQVFANMSPKSNTLQELKNLINGFNVELIWDLNIMNSTVEEQILMLKEAQLLGLPVRFVELGQEFYSNGDTDRLGNNYATRFPTVATYIAECENWINAIRKDFPDIEISIVGSDTRSVNAPDRTKLWNSGLGEFLSKTKTDVTMHLYKTSGLPSSLSINDFFSPNNLKTVFAQAKYNVDLYFLEEVPKFPAATNVWVTEFNLLQKPATPLPGSWSHALYIAIESLELMSHSQIKNLIFYAASASAAFGASFDNTTPYDQSDFLVSVPNAFSTALFQLSSTGEFISLFSRTIQGTHTMNRLNFNGKNSDLIGFSFLNRDGKKKYMILNLNDQSRTLAIQGRSFEQLYARPDVRPSNIEKITHINGVPNGSVLLPAYSITSFE